MGPQCLLRKIKRKVWVFNNCTSNESDINNLKRDSLEIQHPKFEKSRLGFIEKKVNRKVQGMPQSQIAANPRHQEEAKKDKNIHAQNKQTNVREAQRPAPTSPSEVIRMLKQTEKRGHRAREDFKTLSAPWYKPQSYTELRTTPESVHER